MIKLKGETAPRADYLAGGKGVHDNKCDRQLDKSKNNGYIRPREQFFYHTPPPTLEVSLSSVINIIIPIKIRRIRDIAEP